MPAGHAFTKRSRIRCGGLRTDVIDVYQVHWPDPKLPIEETAAAMADLQRAGKIRAIGVSNFSPAQMNAFRKVAPLHTAQPPYNLFERAIEQDVLPYCRDRKHRHPCLRIVVQGSALGSHDAGRRSLPGMTCARNDPKFQAPRFEQYLRASRKARSFRASKLRKARHPSRPAVGY